MRSATRVWASDCHWRLHPSNLPRGLVEIGMVRRAIVLLDIVFRPAKSNQSPLVTGNPNVTPEVTREVVLQQRLRAARLLLKEM